MVVAWVLESCSFADDVLEEPPNELVLLDVHRQDHRHLCVHAV